MAENAQIWVGNFCDADGVPYANCYAQFFDSTGSTRKAVWTSRDKSLPTANGTVEDIEGDEFGRIVAYGDGLYTIVVRAAGDEGANSPLYTFNDVQLTAAQEAYDGEDANFSLSRLEDQVYTGWGRVATALESQSTTTLNLGTDYFDKVGRTYVVKGPQAMTTYKAVAWDDYEDGSRITIECSTNPFRLRARRDDDDDTYNLELGSDFLMSVGSSIDLELRNGTWYERARFFYQDSYELVQDDGQASSSVITIRGNVVKITGTEQIRSIYWVKSGQMPPPGTVIHLHFTAGASVKDAAGSGGNCQLEDDYTAQNNSSLTLVSVGSYWLELARTGEVKITSITKTLGDPSNGKPSVSGTANVYYTGAGNTLNDVTNLTNPGDPGRIITIIQNCAKDPQDNYLNVRKMFRNQANEAEGYLHLTYENDFGMVPGDALTLQCLVDNDGVKYWGEISRKMENIAPEIELDDNSIVVWRPAHRVNTGDSNTTFTISEILPAYGAGYTQLLFWNGPGGTMRFEEEGSNYVVPDDSVEVNRVGEIVICTALPAGLGGTTATKNWSLLISAYPSA